MEEVEGEDRPVCSMDLNHVELTGAEGYRFDELQTLGCRVVVLASDIDSSEGGEARSGQKGRGPDAVPSIGTRDEGNEIWEDDGAEAVQVRLEQKEVLELCR